MAAKYYCKISAELRFTYLKKPYFVTMGTFHMGILLPFNNSESLSLKELLETTKLPEKELVKQLQSLIDVKIIIPNEVGC